MNILKKNYAVRVGQKHILYVSVKSKMNAISFYLQKRFRAE